MALDPRISLGVQPMQMPDPLAQYGKIAALQQAQNQNALAQYQLGAAQRADEQAQNRLRLFQEAGGDPGKVANALLRSGDWEGYTKLTKGEAETGDLRAKTIAKHMELSKERLSSVRTPEDYLAWHQANHADPVLAAYFQPMGITSESQTPKIIEQLGQPGGFEALFKQSALGLDKAMEHTLTSQNLGGTTQVLSTPKYTLPGTAPKATVVPGSVSQVTMAPGEAEKIAISRGQLGVAQGQLGVAQGGLALRQQELEQGATRPVFKDGQWITPPTGMAPGEVREVVSPIATKDAKEALNLIDQASKLIPKATGSYLGNLLDTAAQAIGVGTGGAQATAQLQALEGILVSKMPKMSGPQSDKDVALYRQMAGNIGNPNVPPSIKQEALKTIKEIQERYAGVPKAGGGAFTQQQPASKPPAGIDAALWNVMTPQERALWQK